ncbi:hypothetical protein R1flu_004603 [Riccia fluitans]|uniref:Uncharacterized protein n=1 Tax=Riccia fluitans TaxID=41844 RepID=A0ABD1YQT1_9MARC
MQYLYLKVVELPVAKAKSRFKERWPLQTSSRVAGKVISVRKPARLGRNISRRQLIKCNNAAFVTKRSG